MDHPFLRALLVCGSVGAWMVGGGCGRPARPFVPVRGTILLDGEALGGKYVEFMPDAGTAGIVGGARADDAGRFEVYAIIPGSTRVQKGLPPGPYRVTVAEPPDMNDLGVLEAEPAARPAAAAPPGGPSPKRIPVAYTSRDATPLRFVIAADQQEIVIDIPSDTVRSSPERR